MPNDLRRRLAENGFRAGLISVQPPEVLSKLMELKNKPAPTPGKATELKIADMDQEPRVVRRYLQLRCGKRSEIVASDVYDELPVLTREAGGVCGHTYPKAQGLLALKAEAEADGRVRLELVPEVHYGEPRQRYVGEGAALILQAGRAQKAFDELTITAALPTRSHAADRQSRLPPGNAGPPVPHLQVQWPVGAETAHYPPRPDATRQPVRTRPRSRPRRGWKSKG